MTKNQSYILVLLVLIIFVGCEIHGSIGGSSGTVDDDYVEEPISKAFIKYEKALRTSNNLVEKIIRSEYSDIYENFVKEGMKSQLNEAIIIKACSETVGAMGPILGYKIGQWGFFPINKDGKDYLISNKIIEHKKGLLNYSFMFEDNGKYEKIVGISIMPRKGARRPSES